MLELILHFDATPMHIGSSSGWLTLAGMIMCPTATSSRMSSGATCSRSATKSISSVSKPLRAKCICDMLVSLVRAASVFDPHPAFCQHGDRELQLVRKPLVGIRETKDVHRPVHVFELSLRIQIALLRLGHADVLEDASDRHLIPARGRFQFGNLGGRQGVKVEQLFTVLFQRMTGNEEAEDFLFMAQPLVLIRSEERRSREE